MWPHATPASVRCSFWKFALAKFSCPISANVYLHTKKLNAEEIRLVILVSVECGPNVSFRFYNAVKFILVMAKKWAFSMLFTIILNIAFAHRVRLRRRTAHVTKTIGG